MKVEKIVVGLLEENCYIVSKKNECLIIDPGDEFNKIDTFITEKGYKVLSVLVTHYHFDHIGALKSIQDKYNIPIIDYNSKHQQNIGGFNFEVINTPGHSEDAVSFYFKEEKIMFVGDFIFKNNIGRVDLEGGSSEEMLKSIRYIKKYPQGIKLFPGHGEETTLKEEMDNNYYLKTESI